MYMCMAFFIHCCKEVDFCAFPVNFCHYYLNMKKKNLCDNHIFFSQ
jgi:hypothetical protein